MNESEQRFLALLIVLILLVTFSHCAHADEEFARDAQGCIYVKRPVPRTVKPGAKVVKRKPGKSMPKTHPDEWDVIGCGEKNGPPPADIFPPGEVVTFGPIPFEPTPPPEELYTVPLLDVPPTVGPPVWFPVYLAWPVIGAPPIAVASLPPPIPEPQSWLLLMGGVALTAAYVRARSPQ